MASATILQNTVDFLAKFPPFDTLDRPNLERVASASEIKYLKKNEILFREGEKPLTHFFMVKKGSMMITQQHEGEDMLVDQCDEGDIFGVRALLAKDTYLSTAKAGEETLLMTISVAVLEQIIEANPKVALFFAAGFAAGISASRPEVNADTQRARRFLLPSQDDNHFFTQTDLITIDENKKIVSCTPHHTVREAAMMMSVHNIGSLLVTDSDGIPLGIITDTDFRKKVVAIEGIIKEKPVTEIMSSPVRTIRAGMTIAEVMLKMVAQRVSHFCITEDGTPRTKALGIVSQRDMLVAQGNNPAVLAKQIRQSRRLEELENIRQKAEKLVENYLRQEVSVPFVSNIITEINDLLIARVADLAAESLAREGKTMPEVKWCWLSMGSEGRKEQLLRTDQDNFLIYEDTSDPEVRAYFLEFAKQISYKLTACGFAQCPADMMASNPKWCQPLSVWKNYFQEWIQKPDLQALLMTNIFFDFRPILGHFELAEDLRNTIFEEINRNKIFISFLAKNALQNPPPLSFFRNFMVEKNGDHRNQFDIKARAMMPFTDAARVFALEHQMKSFGSTFERFEMAAQLEPNLKDICEAAAMAYEILLRYRALHGLKNKDSGRYIDPNDFNKLERQTIRSIFTTVEKLQKIMEVRYQLAFFR